MVGEANPTAATANNTITLFRNITILHSRFRYPAGALEMAIVQEHCYRGPYEKRSTRRESLVICRADLVHRSD
jgi:hypothetical protein